MRSRTTCLIGLLVLVGFVSPLATSVTHASAPEGLSAEDSERILRDLKDLQGKLARLRSTKDLLSATETDRLADAEVYSKGVVWALRYETKLAARDVELVRKALARGHQRANDLSAGKQPWAAAKGRLVRGHQSAVDGSIQPFGLIVPARYDAARPIRLDVVLHGSMRSVGLSELRFISRFDEGDAGSQAPPESDYLELHPLGRVENCYRWAGETDVCEAIEATCRSYNIDRDRIVLRGMSMGRRAPGTSA